MHSYNFHLFNVSCLTGTNLGYTYTVKVIINPSRKRDAKTLTRHGITDTFTSPLQMKEKLIESFSDHVPGITEIGRFSIGFFESRNLSGKRWIISPEDLEMMYKKFDPGSEIPCILV